MGSKKSQQRIGILGGSFDPIHIGHLIISEVVAEELELSKIIFVPAYIPPHKKAEELAGPEDRFLMVQFPIDGRDEFEISDVEMNRKGKSYTIDTIAELQESFGDAAELFFLIGADTVPELPLWKDVAKLVDKCQFVIVDRPGANAEATEELRTALGPERIDKLFACRVEMPLIGISSTVIRRRVREGKTIHYMVHPEVEKYIHRHSLYA